MISTGRFLFRMITAVSVSCFFVFPILFLPIPVHTSNPVESQLTSGHWNDTNPVVSPNGETVVFSSNEGAGRNQQHNLWMMSKSGTHLTCLVCSTGDKESPEFSPNGSEVAFIRTEGNGSEDVWTVNIHNHVLSRLTFDNALKSEFEWSPNGSSIAFDEFRNGAWTISFASFDDSLKLPSVPLHGINPSFSANGSVLLFSSDKSQNESSGYHIWSLNLHTMNLFELTLGKGNDTHPVLSPDGRRIAFFSDRGGMRTLWMMDSNGSEMAEAVSNPMTIAIPEAASTSVPLWLPDSSGVLYYSAIFDNFSDVYVFYPNVNITWTTGTPYQFYETVGSNLVRITIGFSVNVSPSYDHNTKTVIFASTKSATGYSSSTFKIWRIGLGPQTPFSPTNPYGQ